MMSTNRVSARAAADPLFRYRRTERPEREAMPQPPESADTLVTAGGLSFVLVREAMWSDEYGRMCCWFTWRDDQCVGFITTTVGSAVPEEYGVGAPLTSRRQLNVHRTFTIWRSVVTEGHRHGLSPMPSQGLGIMTAAYAHVIEDLSGWGCALAGNPEAKTPGAKALWKRLLTNPSITIVKSRVHERHYALWLPRAEHA